MNETITTELKAKYRSTFTSEFINARHDKFQVGTKYLMNNQRCEIIGRVYKPADNATVVTFGIFADQ